MDNSEKGFVLPTAIMLIFILTISGAGFLQYLFTELRMAGTEVDNHGAFYLANAGIERARETFKIPDTMNWTSILNGSNANYPTDAAPDVLLCPDPSRGCVIPPFGASVTNGIPFDNSFQNEFDGGRYEVRAFNNEPGTTDTDQRLTFRALGLVRGQQKIIQIDAMAVSNMDLINCRQTAQDGANTPCPTPKNNGGTPGTPQLTALDGREPASHPADDMPALAVPLTDPTSYYRIPGNFPTSPNIVNFVPTGNGNGGSNGNGGGNTTLTVTDNTYYFINSGTTVTISGDATNVVIVSLGNIDIQGANLQNAVIAGSGSVSLSGNVTIKSLETSTAIYPAIISSNVAQQGSASVTIDGNIYSAGDIDLNPNIIQGSLIGANVYIQGTSTQISDGGQAKYYTFMPGFLYSNDSKTTAPVAQSWREVQ